MEEISTSFCFICLLQTRQRKEAFKVDFLSPNKGGKGLKEIANELLAPVTKGTGATSSKKGERKGAKEKEKKDDHRLPDDMHLSSRQHVTLFLKLKFYVSRLVLKLLHFFISFKLKMRGYGVQFKEVGDGEVDKNYSRRTGNR
jgi:condensin complex subunit 2